MLELARRRNNGVILAVYGTASLSAYFRAIVLYLTTGGPNWTSEQFDASFLAGLVIFVMGFTDVVRNERRRQPFLFLFYQLIVICFQNIASLNFRTREIDGVVLQIV